MESVNLINLDKFITGSRDEMSPAERAISIGLLAIAERLQMLVDMQGDGDAKD